MNNKQAIDVIEEALNVSSKKGVFSLKDAVILQQAINVLQALIEKKEESVQVEKSNKK